MRGVHTVEKFNDSTTMIDNNEPCRSCVKKKVTAARVGREWLCQCVAPVYCSSSSILAPPGVTKTSLLNTSSRRQKAASPPTSSMLLSDGTLALGIREGSLA